MTNVIVAIFRTSDEAAAMLRSLGQMKEQGTAEITDVCGLFRDSDGVLALDQMFGKPDRLFVAALCLGGSLGFLSGLLMSGILPAILAGFAGALAGLAFSAIAVTFRDYGLNDDFLYKVGSELTADPSAVVVLHPPQTASLLLSEFDRAKATILQTHYGFREQQALQERLAAMLRRMPRSRASI